MLQGLKKARKVWKSTLPEGPYALQTKMCSVTGFGLGLILDLSSSVHIIPCVYLLMK